MRDVYEVLQWIQLFVWSGVALSAVRTWKRRQGEPSKWLAVTFSSLALVVIIGRFNAATPESQPPVLVSKMLLSVLALFPYFLYRFMASLIPPRKWFWRVAHGLTIATLVAGLGLPRILAQGEPRPGWYQAYLLLFVVHWAVLCLYVAWKLWRARKGQPSVAANRMRYMGAGSAATAIALLAAGAAQPTSDITSLSLIVSLAFVASGPLFLVGFSPPSLLLALWRRKEEQALREVQASLIAAETQSAIAESLLPRVAGLVGGSGAALFGKDRGIIFNVRLDRASLSELTPTLSTEQPLYEPKAYGSSFILRMEAGYLAIQTSPFTPFFGEEELKTIQAFAALMDLALTRARATELQEQATEAMRDFVATASHDLRTPVTVIKGFALTLSERWDDFGEEQKREFAAAITRHVNHLNRLIGDLLTVSTIDTGGVEVRPQSVDVGELAKEVVASLAGSNDVLLEVLGNAFAHADPDHVRRILENYLRNAQIYGAPPIRLEVEGHGGWVEIRVRDQGAGLSLDFVPHLFERFARAEKKKSKAAQGTGLGLSIVRGLARANGGEAWYEVNQPRGSCFGVRLPAFPIGVAE